MTWAKAIVERSLLLFLAVCAGYWGSSIRAKIRASSSESIVRAERFELVDAKGNTRAVLGQQLGSQANPRSRIALAFLDSTGIRCELGIGDVDGAPFLALLDKEHRERATLLLGYGSDPVLLMQDGRSVRASLGAIHGDAPSHMEDQWSLELTGRRPGVQAGIGFRRGLNDSYTSGVTLGDGSGKKWIASIGKLEALPLARRRNQ
jgi:hypothetical protein